MSLVRVIVLCFAFCVTAATAFTATAHAQGVPDYPSGCGISLATHVEGGPSAAPPAGNRIAPGAGVLHAVLGPAGPSWWWVPSLNTGWFGAHAPVPARRAAGVPTSAWVRKTGAR